MTQEYFKPLDAIRGLLAIAVMFYHAHWASTLTGNAFSRNGYLAVDVFFCLSGFLMFQNYGNMKTAGEAKIFMIKRFARIYPLHVFSLFAMLGFISLRLIAYHAGMPILETGEPVPLSLESQDNIFSFISNLTLTQALGVPGVASFNGPAWSISTEFYTYILFAIMVIVFPIKTTARFAGLAIFGALIYLWLASFKPNLDITYDYGFFRCIAGFAAGIVAYRLYLWSKPIFAGIHPMRATLIESVMLLGFVTWFCAARGAATFTIAPVMMALIVIFAHDKGRISAVMNHSVFQYLGKISYSVYLLHALILVVMTTLLSKTIGGTDALSPAGREILSFAYVAVVMISAHISYHVVEKPASKYIRSRFLAPKGRLTKLQERIGRIATPQSQTANRLQGRINMIAPQVEN